VGVDNVVGYDYIILGNTIDESMLNRRIFPRQDTTKFNQSQVPNGTFIFAKRLDIDQKTSYIIYVIRNTTTNMKPFNFITYVATQPKEIRKQEFYTINEDTIVYCWYIVPIRKTVFAKTKWEATQFVSTYIGGKGGSKLIKATIDKIKNIDFNVSDINFTDYYTK
jgi:hypothetical protein